jgi:hypothetical protein
MDETLAFLGNLADILSFPLTIISILVSIWLARMNSVKKEKLKESEKLLLNEEEKRKKVELELHKAEIQNITSRNHGIIGTYEEHKVISYVENEDITEMWLSGSALLICIKKVLEALDGDKYYFSNKTGEFKLKLILTDIESSTAKKYAASRLPDDQKDPELESSNINLKEAYSQIILLIGKLKKIYTNVEYEIFLNKNFFDERIWMMKPNKSDGLSFIKLYPFKNKDCNGVYLGGFKFALQNNEELPGFKFYKDKFEEYAKKSNPVDLNKLKELTNSNTA